MIAQRFYRETLSAGVIRLGEAEARHARVARRLSVGDPVVLFDGRGHEATGRIVTAARTGVEAAIGEVAWRDRPTPRLTLAVALPKGPRQDVLIEKCAELGTAAIQPLITQRSVASASDHKRRRWARTTIEVAKQSGQCWLPELHEPRKLEPVVSELPGFDRAIVAACAHTASSATAHTTGSGPASVAAPAGVMLITDLLSELADAERVLALVGPEGGWTEAEFDMLVTAGAQPVRLGPHVLRIETATIALAAAIHAVARNH